VLKENNPGIKTLLIIPPPICAYRWGKVDLAANRNPQRTAEHTALYASKARSVADELDIPYVDLWTEFLTAVGWKPSEPIVGSTNIPQSEKLGELLHDGLHFSPKGNELCFRAIFDKIKRVYPELDPEHMGTNVPWWDMDKDILAILKEQVSNW
jgi:isoamyl acetate esterase